MFIEELPNDNARVEDAFFPAVRGVTGHRANLPSVDSRISVRMNAILWPSISAFSCVASAATGKLSSSELPLITLNAQSSINSQYRLSAASPSSPGSTMT